MPGVKIVSSCLINSSFVKAKKLDKILKKFPYAAEYISFNPNVNLRLMKKYKDLKWNLIHILRYGKINFSQLKEIFPHLSDELLICSSEIDDETVGSYLKKYPNPRFSFNANSKISLKYILKNPTLNWNKIEFRPDFNFKIFLDNQIINWNIDEVFKNASYADMKEYIYPKMFAQYLLYRNKHIQVNEIIELCNLNGGIILSRFGNCPNLTFDFVLKNKDEFKKELSLLKCSFTLERQIRQLIFYGEIRIKSICNISF